MTIENARKTTVTANGRSNWVKLTQNQNRVVVKCPNWSGTSIAVKFNNEDSTNDCDLKDSDGPIVLTGNEAIDVDGPGMIGGVVSNYGGTPIVVEVLG